MDSACVFMGQIYSVSSVGEVCQISVSKDSLYFSNTWEDKNFLVASESEAESRGIVINPKI